MKNIKKFAVLVSGNGTNLQALIDAIETKKLPAEISLVVSNSADAFAVQRAQNARIKTIVLERKPGEKRNEYDCRLRETVATFAVDYVFLLGWMRILTNSFLQHFTVLNLHPALPDTFIGVDCIEKQFNAFQNGEIHTCGIMTHFVPDEKVDRGPLIFSQTVPCYKGERLECFEERVHQAEHALVVKTVEFLLKT